MKRERQNQKAQHRNQRNDQHQNQHQHAQIHLPVDAMLQSLLAENLSGFEREEKKRRVVGDRSHVVGITLREPRKDRCSRSNQQTDCAGLSARGCEGR